MRLAVALRRVGLGLLIGSALGFAVLAVGPAVVDPGGPAGLALTVALLVPPVAAAAFVRERPHAAPGLAAGLTLALVALSLLALPVEPAWHDLEAPRVPIREVAGLAVGVVVAIFGYRQPLPGAILLLVVGLAPTALAALAALAARAALAAGRPGPARPGTGPIGGARVRGSDARSGRRHAPALQPRSADADAV